MNDFYYFKSICVISICNLFICATVFAGNVVVESDFCLELAERECSIPIVSNEVALSQIVSVENGIKRLYFRSKIAVDEDESIMHIWSLNGTDARTAEQVYVSKSDKLKNITPETVDRVYEHLRQRYKADPLANSVQAVLLSIRKSPGFRTYSKIKVTPGDYTVEVCGLDGNVIPGGEAKSIKILP